LDIVQVNGESDTATFTMENAAPGDEMFVWATDKSGVRSPGAYQKGWVIEQE
jgi:hypothetical protein